VIARGSSDAETWTQDGVVAAPMPDDDLVTMVRDPFLFDLGGRRWALQGAGLADGRGALLLYGADDLDEWEYHGFLLTSADPVASGLPGCDVWECPQLVRSGDDWVVMVSLWRPNDHGGVGYLVGSLAIDEGTGLPAFAPRATGVVDDGIAFYAPQAVQTGGVDGRPERVLVWGWAEEKAPAGVRGRTQEDNDEAGWSGLLTFPRELLVHGDTVELRPARELDALRGDSCDGADLPDQVEVVLSGAGAVRLRLAADGEDGQLVWAEELAEGDEVRVLIDASIVEIHRAGGRSTTLRAYPVDGEGYRLDADAGVTVEAHHLGIPA
jgi:beta-fructofuranosidase